jgi:sarcosine oxidase/L-pipecolate oxidase
MTHENAQKTYENAKALEPRIELLNTPDEVRAKLSPSGRGVVGDIALNTKSYFNPSGGWVHASGAIAKLYDEIKTFPAATLVPGADLQSLIMTDDGCADGRQFYADKIVMALGSWTGGHPALKGIFPEGLLVPTGQTVAAVQLTKDECERYKDMPTISNLDGTGYYSFPVS